MTAQEFTPESLVGAIRKLFQLNNYEVTGPVHLHGAEVDLVAKPKTDPFGSAIYVEATIEYVDNTKYGKDLSKLALLGEKDPQARRLIVSSKGFTLSVAERARETRIECLTYRELFAKFEQFEPYVRYVLEEDRAADELRELERIYEEPSFDDGFGADAATQFLSGWLSRPTKNRWIVVTGEYGTGKTALTRVLQRRWLSAYKLDPELPIPFRIELRDFTHQFDARGLLHHFLDHNKLHHVSIEFVLSLIRSGRVVMLLDGYDEMAQYMHARERRACLEALAELSADGARGLITSRPNYFSEAEELQLFEILYKSLHSGFYLSRAAQDTAQDLVRREREVDTLLGSQFIDRYERQLRDLTEQQTESLVRRILAGDSRGQAIVLGVLQRVFRSSEPGSPRTLSGKPVIISYLLEVVESLKAATPAEEALSEWQVYNLIVERLMLRDHHRSPLISPQRRVEFLEQLAVGLSKRENPVFNEQQLRELVEREFAQELRRVSGASRAEEADRYFADLRSSATLTRVGDGAISGWRFSHNSLREYFLTRHLVTLLERSTPPSTDIPITDPMKVFLASLPDTQLQAQQTLLAGLWGHEQKQGVGSLFCLLWEGIVNLHRGEADPIRAALEAVAGHQLDFSGVHLQRVRMSLEGKVPSLINASFKGAILVDVDLATTDLSRVDFSGALLENVGLSEAILTGASFSGAYLADVDLSGVEFGGADFGGISAENISILTGADASQPKRYAGNLALGYLRFNGASTDAVPVLSIVFHHPSFDVLEKMLRRLSEQGSRQRRGLVQRGAAQKDPDFAEALMAFLEAEGFVESSRGRRDLVSLSELGRGMVGRALENGDVPAELESFLLKRLGPKAA